MPMGTPRTTAEYLGINQPSISKRLAAIRRLTGERIGQPWLVRKGKRWRLTSEGARVQLVVADLVKRYEQLDRFLAGGAEGSLLVSIACGQQAAGGFVRVAIEQFIREHSGVRVRLSTPRGRKRIEGVAAGQYDLAVVTDSPSTIRKIARREMFIEQLFDDHFVLAANPPPKTAWGRHWHDLPLDQPATAAKLLDLPFILPEADSSRRGQFEEWFYRATQKALKADLEVGAWQTILEFVESGLGVGFVPQSSVEMFRERRRCKLTTRPLNPTEFPPDAVRLIARKAHGKEEPDLTGLGKIVADLLRGRKGATN